jgi:hypothetical protein
MKFQNEILKILTLRKGYIVLDDFFTAISQKHLAKKHECIPFSSKHVENGARHNVSAVNHVTKT